MVDPALFRALDLARGLESTANAITKVARSTDSSAASWAFAQWELRKRAEAKFSKAAEMLFVKEALEQATHERLSQFHASLFPPDRLVLDLTTGIGSDLIALARRGPVLGFEIDHVRATYATHNLTVHGLEGNVRQEDSMAWVSENPRSDYCFADPARRVDGKRTLDIAAFTPDPRALAQIFRRCRLGVMKLSPMLNDSDLKELGEQIVFVSFGNECREVLVISGKDSHRSVSAYHVESGQYAPESELPAQTDSPMEFLYEVDPALSRAHGAGNIASEHGAMALGDSHRYMTGTFLVPSPWVKAFRVLYHGSLDTKRINQELRALEAACPELKQSGAGLDLLQERKKYSDYGPRKVSLAFWPVVRSIRYAILELAPTAGA